jgi:hypothetical protein
MSTGMQNASGSDAIVPEQFVFGTPGIEMPVDASDPSSLIL